MAEHPGVQVTVARFLDGKAGSNEHTEVTLREELHILHPPVVIRQWPQREGNDWSDKNGGIVHRCVLI